MNTLRSWCTATWREVTWAEVSGSVGDLGTFLPLLIGLVQKVQLDLGTTLVVTGVYNIVSGWQFGIPMCVQPMKTIAAVALASTQPSLTLSQLLHAGLFVAGCVLLLGASRLVDVVNWLVPRPVVRGVQLAVGAKLAMKGIDMALRVHPAEAAVQWRPWLGAEGLLLGAAALALLVATTIAPRVSAPGSDDASEDGGLGPRPPDTPIEPLARWLARWRAGGASEGGGAPRSTIGTDGVSSGKESGEASRLLSSVVDPGSDVEIAAAAANGARAKTAATTRGGCVGAGNGDCGGCGGGGGDGARRVPSALLAVAAGLVIAVATQPGMLAQLRLGPSVPRLLRPSWPDLREGALRAGLPQLPLTTLNSVIAVTQLADSLFPDRQDASRWRPSAVALSLGLLNAAGCWVGAMPCCHGAGGLAAQYKFGARTGAAPVLLGCVKAGLGLLFGGSLAALLAAFPAPLLGALLAVAGVELAAAVRHTRTPRGYTFALLTAAAILALDNTGTGFLLGLAAVVLAAAYDRVVAAMERWAASAAEAEAGRGGAAAGGWWRPAYYGLGGAAGARLERPAAESYE